MIVARSHEPDRKLEEIWQLSEMMNQMALHNVYSIDK